MFSSLARFLVGSFPPNPSTALQRHKAPSLDQRMLKILKGMMDGMKVRTKMTKPHISFNFHKSIGMVVLLAVSVGGWWWWLL